MFGELPAATARLIVFPHAGGAASEQRTWTSPAGVAVSTAVLPGRGHRAGERPHRSMDSLVDEALASFPTDVPYRVYGHSFGGWVAYEVIRALEEAGRPGPDLFVVGARGAPHVSDTRMPKSNVPQAELIERIQSLYDGIPDKLLERPELLAHFLAPLRADLRIIERYAPLNPPKLACPIRALFGTDDESVPLDGIEGWAALTHSFEHESVPGGHFFHRPKEFLMEWVWR